MAVLEKSCRPLCKNIYKEMLFRLPWIDIQQPPKKEQHMALSIDSKVGELLDNPQAKAILDKHMDGFSTNPQIGMAKGFPLKMVAGMSGGKITPQMLEAVSADLARL